MALIQQATREFLAPIAEEYDRPLDPGLVSAMMFEFWTPAEGQPRSWVVHLYTVCPGLVIGRKGVTADALRQRLCEVAGDGHLKLNLIDFAPIHERRRELTGGTRPDA